jgi:HNH endonuclease
MAKALRTDLPVVAGVEFRRVKRFPGYAVGDDGSVWSSRHGRWKRLKSRLCHKRSPNGERDYYQVALYANEGAYRRDYKVSQLVLETFVGPRPKGMEAMHFPDPDSRNNRRSNLKWGTHSENMAHAVACGTLIHPGLQGEASPLATLSEAQVREIHALAATVPLREIARRFRITDSHVHAIVHGYRWQHLKLRPYPSLACNLSHPGDLNPGAKLSRRQVLVIRQRFAAGGVTQLQLSKEYGVSDVTISRIISRTSWKRI